MVQEISKLYQRGREIDLLLTALEKVGYVCYNFLQAYGKDPEGLTLLCNRKKIDKGNWFKREFLHRSSYYDAYDGELEVSVSICNPNESRVDLLTRVDVYGGMVEFDKVNGVIASLNMDCFEVVLKSENFRKGWTNHTMGFI